MSKNRELPILRVVQIGDNQFERYVIEDEQAQVWTGERFDFVGGTLFARHDDAAAEAQNILKKNFDDVEPQRYVVPLYVEVLNHSGPVSVAQIAKYLSDSSRLFLNTVDHGNGPGDALVLPWIVWSRIEPIKEFPND